MWKRLFSKKQSIKLPITIVSGLPRSGTSMMMQMLQAGGMGLLTDHVRQADEDNPKGYWEFEPVKHTARDASWLDTAHGKAVKIVSMLLYELPPERQYSVLFMQRDLGEVLASQNTMLRRHKKETKDNGPEMKRMFTDHLAKMDLWLAQQRQMQVLYINYSEVLADPLMAAQTVNIFLGRRLDTHKMAQVIDAALYRNKA